ncbi:hypothetical protein C7441_11094 [Pseudaminobacter salicylatoxidans]|uniref:Uncharacterized protein n=1 Tax=Pseudaminobacter salicylatoxidans TaxID=93369 RepID=A0A316C0P4_PSESE|nr:hypothetical protein [Pseudaminobacter salicylatoxidans]PWJ81562.1 hypothetical protein C7441_11094 [Pseudaminobacter salicylatoxidans]
MKTGNAVYGRCDCGHVWPVVYLPMRLDQAAKVMSRSACPKCGNAKDIKLAKAEEIAASMTEIDSRADGGADIVTKHTNIKA